MRSAFLVVVASLLATVSAAGQTASVSAGDTVRIWASHPELRGARSAVHAVTQDSLDLVLPAGGAAVTSVAWADIRRLDVQRGRHSRWRAALWWGLGVGLGSAVAAGGRTNNPSDRELTVPLAGSAGFAVGATLGSLRDPRRWVTVPLPRP
jgi:hypothetical protein